MVFQVDPETISIIAFLGLLLVVVILILVLTRRYSKKALRRWMVEKGDRSLKSDKAYNTLLAVKTVAKTFEGQGMDVGSVKPLIADAESEMELKNYSSSMELADKAKNILIELKSKRDKKEKEGVKSETEEIDVNDLKFPPKEEYKPTTKEVLQKKYPPNYFQAKFTMGVVEKRLSESDLGQEIVSEAGALMEQGKQSFESEDFDGALVYFNRSKRLLEGEKVDAPSNVPKLKEKLNCPRCKYEAMENDLFCRRCGHKLSD